MTEVAWIGLGAMGSRMAARIRDEGHELVVWNRTREKAEELGVPVAASPREAAARAEIVFTMLADPEALRAVTEDGDGIVAGLREGAVLLEMSTVGPQAIARLSERMPSHASLLDVPVLGSLPEAEAGELRLFAGGEDAPLERALPLLRVLGEPLHVGGPGSGAAAKLVANATLVGTIALLGETLALADGLGLPRETVFDVLSVTPLAAQAERAARPSRPGSIRLGSRSRWRTRMRSSSRRRLLPQAATSRRSPPRGIISRPRNAQASAPRITSPCSSRSLVER